MLYWLKKQSLGNQITLMVHWSEHSWPAKSLSKQNKEMMPYRALSKQIRKQLLFSR